MKTIFYFARKIKNYIIPKKNNPYPVVVEPTGTIKEPIGSVLLSYLEYPLLWAENSTNFNGHSNAWESRTIARIFQELGYRVVAINYKDRDFVPHRYYDVVFDIFENLGRWSSSLDHSTKKFLHCTGSDPNYQNSSEIRRVNAVNARRNAAYSPKRLIAQPELTYKSMDVADAISLIGNEKTCATYPQKYWPKMKLVPVTASFLPYTKTVDELVPLKREFLWFFGKGAVHKGLDLVLEVFYRCKDLTLNVVGNLEQENDFMKMYKRELLHTNNIHYHGFLYPSSQEFQNILKNTFCFIAPSCSEAISTAAVTCLTIGLYPIVSRDTGVTLPDGFGTYLEACSIEEIEQEVRLVHGMSKQTLVEQIQIIQMDALTRYSRDTFRNMMKQYILKNIELTNIR